MTRTIAGLRYRIHSPSHYELVHGQDSADQVHVCYVGGQQWMVYYVHADDQVSNKAFASRDDAMTLLSLARNVA